MCGRALIVTLALICGIVGGCAPKPSSTSDTDLERSTGASSTQPQQREVTLSDKKDEAGISEVLLGIPYYPGSKHLASNAMSETGAQTKGFISTRSTPDEAKAVADFYLSLLSETRVEDLPSQGAATSLILSGTRDGRTFGIVLTRLPDQKETLITMSSTAGE